MANDMFLDGTETSLISRVESMGLSFFFIIFMVYNLRLMNNIPFESPISIKYPTRPKPSLYVLFGSMGLILGAKMILESASDIARAHGFLHGS